MAKKGGPSIKGMHIAFGIASVMLLAATIYAFVQDHFGRQFPRFQSQYDELEMQRLQNQQAEIDKRNDEDADLKEELAAIEKKIADAEAVRDQKQGDINDVKKRVKEIDDQLSFEVRNINADKALRDEMKYQIDAHVGHLKIEDLDKLDEKIRGRFATIEGLKKEREEKLKSIADVEENVRKAQANYDRLVASAEDVRLKIKRAIGNPIIKVAKDFPGVDFVSPRHHIDQVVLKNLPQDFFFSMTQRNDRCVTCHQGIDNPDPMYRDQDTEKIPAVLRSHPRMDLFVGANSKHPYNKFGCTICHQGRPMAVEFSRATHMPRNEEQEERWKKEYGWKEFEFWDQKMLPLQYTEASCLKCHRGTDSIPEANKLNEGRELFRERGCTNCHMGTSGEKDFAWVGRVGPDLRRIGEKTNIDWARRWIENPWDFRPSTKMPRFFGLENRTDLQVASADGKDHVLRDPVEVEAISTYLFMTSKLREKTNAEPKAGDVESGKKLFTSVGCVACHSTRDAADKIEISSHGPDLSRIGEKVSAGWLLNWIKHPRHYWPETKMPELRLSDKEAEDITAYLMNTMKSKDAKNEKLGTAPEYAFEAIIREKLASTNADEKITDMLKDPVAMLDTLLKKKVKYAAGVDEKLKDTGDGEWTEAQIEKIKSIVGTEPRTVKAFYAGENLIQHHGCFGCHNIQGWTYAPLTGVNLLGEADKELDKFDFGKTLNDHSVPHTKWDWFYTKISRPRVFDIGKQDLIKAFDRLRMPWFGYPGKAAAGHGEKKEGGEGPDVRAHGELSPGSNKDNSTPYGLTPTQVERLVTHLLSLTAEPIPTEMQRAPSPQDVAIDHGQRVIRELNCTSCHVAGIDTGSHSEVSQLPKRIPLESLVALYSPLALRNPGDGLYLNQDAIQIDYSTSDAAIDGFINVKRGTYLTSTTVPILLYEMKVRSHALEPLVAAGFRLDRKKGKGGDWRPYGELVSLEKFQSLTVPLFFPDEATAAKAYDKLKGQFADAEGYERIAGSAALNPSPKQIDDRKQQRKWFEPASVSVRFTRGEGKVIQHMIDFETAKGTQSPSAQLGPPSLSFEGGKVQPDWLYQFLRNVHILRTGLSIRMPSFWTDGPYSAYKKIYPAGHLSAIDPARRPKEIDGEPAPSSEAVKIENLPDDAAQIVEFFVADAHTPAFGFQTLPMSNAEAQSLYDTGKKLVTGDEKSGGMGCFNCHTIGKRVPGEPKYAPNLAWVKRRLREPWLNRFLINPQSIYPWANMPNNFKFDWQENYNFNLKDVHRGMFDGDEAKMKDAAEKLKAVKFFLMNMGEAEINGQ